MTNFSVNQTYGVYTVLKYLGNDFYKVQCEICNKTKILLGDELFNIVTKCICKKNSKVILKVDQKIDKLLLLEFITIKKDNKQPAKYWKVKCDCGNILLRSRSYMHSKGLKSCGKCNDTAT